MTKEEIIALAREADLHCHAKLTEHGLFVEDIEHFANLVAAAEREACARVCEVHGGMAKHAVWMAEECAALIRARGNDGA